MKRKKRKPLPTDDVFVDYGVEILSDFIEKHDEIESTLWASVLWSRLVMGYQQCGWTFEQFCEEIEKVKEHYKSWWEE